MPEEYTVLKIRKEGYTKEKAYWVVDVPGIGLFGPYSNAPLFEVARDLIASGENPDMLVTSITEPSTVESWEAAPLHYWARWKIEEGDRGIKRRAWKPELRNF